MIQVNHVSLILNKKQILKDITLKLERGHIYGLTGNNGCGKTMLMKCICGFLNPSAGEITANGKIIGKDTDYLPDCGIIIETPGFIPHYSGFKNLKLLADIRKNISDSDIRHAFLQVGLNPDLKQPVKKYSLGMRQRLGLAQAVMENPSVLILDEPMNGLDKSGVADIRNLLLSFKKENRMILITSHNAQDIHVLCDKVYEMDNGMIC